MVTRSQSGIIKPIDRLSLHATFISALPKSPFLALQNPHWNNVMDDEYNALVKNDTWILVPRPTGINLVRFMWLFKHKFHADGTLSRYKARLVANGSSQQIGIDCDETFSPVVKPATIRTVLSLAVSRKDLRLLIYLSMWMTLFLQLPLHTYYRLFLSQKQYAIKLLARAHMTNCNPLRTLVDTDSKLGPEGVPVQDLTLYRSLADGLQYLTFTRPNISYVVQQICLYMHDPREPHLAALKRILRYILGTLDFGFHLYSSTTISLVAYTDADWAGYPQQGAVTAWLRNLLRELHSPLSATTLVYCDNVSATYISSSPCALSALFEDFRSSLSVYLPPARTAGAY
nr:ribonuclease H-like domain-containing protein [Tanacetum cinerariifolium]